jgi:hypothetical protein
MAEKHISIYDFEVFQGQRKNFDYSILLVVNFTPYNKKLKSIFRNIDYSIMSSDSLTLAIDTLG